MAYHQHNDSGVISSPDSHTPYHHSKIRASVTKQGAAEKLANNGFRMAPETVYTSTGSDEVAVQDPHQQYCGRIKSRCSSVVSFASNASLNEAHFDDLKLAAQLGKILLKRNRKLEFDVEESRRDIIARDKEIAWLRENQASKDRFYEEQVDALQSVQSLTKQLRQELTEKSSELERTKAHLNFQAQRTGDLETQLQKELQSSLHQKVRRNLSDGNTNDNGDVEKRHASAEVAYSQSRMAAEIEEMQLQHMEDIAAQKFQVQKLEILLDESNTLLAQAEHNNEQLERDKVALISQVQEMSALQVTFQTAEQGPLVNELESIDETKKQAQYEVLTGKFERILESIEVEKQRAGIISETGSQGGFSRSGSMRVKVREENGERPAMLARYLSAPARKESHLDASNYGSKRRPNHPSGSQEPSDDAYLQSAFDRDYSTLTVKANDDDILDDTLRQQSPVEKNSPEASSPLRQLEQNLEDLDLETDAVSVGSDDSDDEFNINIGQHGLSDEMSQEEPEYKRLFQELFDLIHTVIPEGE